MSASRMETGTVFARKLSRGSEDRPFSRKISPKAGSQEIQNHNDKITSPKQREASNTSTVDVLQLVTLSEFLEEDERPSFIVDITDSSNLTGNTLNLLFANSALEVQPPLLDHVRGSSKDNISIHALSTPFSDFRAWVLSLPNTPHIITSFPFAGVLWKSVLVRHRLRVISGYVEPMTPLLVKLPSTTPLSQYDYGNDSSRVSGMTSRLTGSPGYFDLKPRKRTEAPGIMETLYRSSRYSESPTAQAESMSVPCGDIRYAELFSGQLSPHSERTSLPPRRKIESVQSSPDIPTIQGFFDWTRLPLSPDLPDHLHFARSVNWGATTLGSMDTWSPGLRAMCNLIMASPHPSAMYWGKDNVAIYNEAYVVLAGKKHPELMGSRYSDAWAEIWDMIKGVFDDAYQNAHATMKDDDCLFVERNGFLEEVYFSWSIIPLIGDDGTVVGLYNPAFEKTRRKIAERRMLTLKEVGEQVATAREVTQFWALLLQGLAYNEFDAPLVMVYSLNDDNSDTDTQPSGSSTGPAAKICRLEGTLGIEPGHPAAPVHIDMKTSTDGLADSFRHALTKDKPIVLSEEDGSLDSSLLEGVEWRGFGDPSKFVVVMPIHPTTGESTLGFLVMGTNPRRPFDEDFELFVQLLARQLATSIASVVLYEDEIKRAEKAAELAAQDRIDLNNQLVARTQEAVEAESKFARMAELSPVGMFMADSEGTLIFVNDAWYDISSFPRDIPVDNTWLNCVVHEDQPKVREMWTSISGKNRAVSIEFRFKTPWRDKSGHEGFTWVIASASPEMDEDGQIKRIFGSLTDISSQKFAESSQTRRMEEALELKRQQEHYIDTTSHEMRNPLTAILQSADSIIGSLSEMKRSDGFAEPEIEILEIAIDSAQTIMLCAQHQKRIVDDVLTLSKLNSAMMVVYPVDSNPIHVLEQTLKMFEGEFQTADIALEFHLDKSYTTLQIDWVRLDPHRLSQILINLITNAIKFTTTEESRTIRIHLGASIEKPSQEIRWKLTYIPSRAPKDVDVTAAPEWGLGENMYIHFAIEDTGRGLTEAEKKLLFQRFAQANPRTHVTYGGSGLGLFISRELVELQGGEIGVASQSGKGSTFAFYVKARKSQPPTNGVDAEQFTAGILPKTDFKKPRHTKVRSQAFRSHSAPLVNHVPALTAFLHSGEVIHALIVEDNLINQKVLSSQLRKIGCVVYVANHGGEAIGQIKQSKFYHTHVNDGIDISVVLLDLEMPVMDGQTCARILREIQESGELVKHIPIIAVTANAREEQIKMTLEAGIDDVVSKPFRIPELVPKMRNLIAKYESKPS